MDKRPRRTTTQKKSDFNEGLLWQEERELTRALYASLQRPRSEQDVSEEQLQHDNLDPESKEPENQVNNIPLDISDLELGPEQQCVESPSSSKEAEPLLLSEPQRPTDLCITTEQQNLLEIVGHSIVGHPVEEHSVAEHSVLDHPVVTHSVPNHVLVDIVHSKEPLNITDPDHHDIQATETFHDLNATIVQPQSEQRPVKKRSPKPRDPAKAKSTLKQKEASAVKESSKLKKSPKVERSSKPRGLSKSKEKSVETKRSHKKKVLPEKFESSKISRSKPASAKASKPEVPERIVTRSRSPRTSSPGQVEPKFKEVSEDASSESIAHRLRASVSVNSGNAMGNVLCRPSRSQERKQNSEVDGMNKTGSDERRNSGDFLPPPPPPLPPPLLPQKHKSNAAVLLKQSVTKCTQKKCFAVSREKSSARAKRVPSVHGKSPKLNPIPKRPLRSLRRDLRSRSKFKMPQSELVTGPSTRRTTRSQNASFLSSSSGASSNTDSQDETKSTSSSTSGSGSREFKARKAKERVVPKSKRKSNDTSVSSTSGEEDDTKASKPKKAKVQAQRKFAYPQAYSPGCTPSKVKNGDMMSSTKSCSIFNHCPSTEDFLTFLCLRGTPALPPSLDLFKVQSKPIPTLLQSMPKQLAGRKRSASSTLRSDNSDITIPGIEPLPRDDSAPATPTATPPKGNKTSPPRLAKAAAMASPSTLQQKMNIRERRLRLDARHLKASGKLSKNLRNSFKSNQNNILGNGPQQLPPNLTPVPPPILAVQRSRHPPPLIPIVPWENKRCQTNNQHSSRNAAQMTGRKSSSVRLAMTRSSGRSSSRNCVPSKNNIVNHRLDKNEDQSPIIATSKAKNSSRQRETHKNNHKNGDQRPRISQRLKNERCSSEVINGSNHLLDELDDAPNGHTLLSQIKLLKGSRRERKEKKCSCHSQNCSQRTRSRHKNGDRDLALGAIEEVLKTAKRQKKLKDLKRRNSRKLRNSSMMLRDRVQAAEVKLDESMVDKADAINNILSTNGISKKLTIPLTNCTLNNNVLRKDSMICPKAHLNHEIERKLTELKIKEDGEEEDSPAPRPNKIRNPLLLKNHKEPLPLKVSSETALQKLQKKAQGQSPRRNRAKTKNGLAPFKSSKEEVPVQTGPSKFLEGVKEGLVLRPSAEEWSDPMAYLESLTDQLNEYGMCRVIPPDGWKPECKPHSNTRFTTEVQYIHRLMHRWKSRSKQLACIKRHLEEREKVAYYPPQISGYEIDLVEFSQVVAQQGGLKTITNNKRWNKVADMLHIPKALQSRVKLDSIYCKFLLSFDTLSKEDKERLEMETELLRKKVASRLRSHDQEYNSSEEVVCKGRPTTLSAYSRMASLTQQMLYSSPNPSLDNIEDDYWKMLDKGEPHVAVHTGQLNATLTASGFTTNRANPYAKHNWNCKNIGRNPSNILHLLPNHVGVNQPLMKMAMLFGSEGWSIDSQGLSQIEYLHTGSPKIWYSVPASYCNKFEELLQSEVPDLCTYQQHCLYRSNLHCMVPPSVLACKGVPVYRLVQEPGEFIIVAHSAARANICTGYSTSEGIPFASATNLQHCLRAFEICQELKQSTLFSVEHLTCVLITNAANLKTNPNLLRDLRTKFIHIRDRELSLRQQLATAGLKSSICFADSETCDDSQSLQAGIKSRNQHATDKGCHVCRQSCYLSMVVSEREDRIYCLHHAYQMITKNKMSGRNFKLLYRYSESQLRELIEGLMTLITGPSNLTTKATSSTTTNPTTAATTAPTSMEAETTSSKGDSPEVATTSSVPPPPPPPLSRPLSPQLPLSSSTSLPLSTAETTAIMSTAPCSSSPTSASPSGTTTSSSPSESRLRKKAER